jgi:hypothetical protein
LPLDGPAAGLAELVLVWRGAFGFGLAVRHFGRQDIRYLPQVTSLRIRDCLRPLMR